MSDSLQLYCTLLDAVRQANPGEDLRRQKVFVWLVVGLLLEKTISLPLIANAIISTAKASSRVRRLQRFLRNSHVCVRAYYDGLIRAALAEWTDRTLYLALDTTSLAGRLVICRVALIYRGRAIPLVWQVYDRKSVMLAWADYKDLLDHARTLLPTPCRVILLGDRGFRTTELMQWCRLEAKWHFRLRLKSDQLVRLADGRLWALCELHLARGMVRFLQQVYLGEEGYGPLNVALAWADTPKADRWFIATDEAAGWSTLTEYSYRMDLEEAFRDDKSGGFQLEDCELTQAARVERLMLVLAVACLQLVSIGTYVVTSGERECVDPHWQRGLSYFQIGWRWLRRYVERAAQIITCLAQLRPTPDPAPPSLPRARRQPRQWTEWTPSCAGP
jgi:hypothetical protein